MFPSGSIEPVGQPVDLDPRLPLGTAMPAGVLVRVSIGVLSPSGMGWIERGRRAGRYFMKAR
jgi:hypothetical protein